MAVSGNQKVLHVHTVFGMMKKVKYVVDNPVLVWEVENVIKEFVNLINKQKLPDPHHPPH